MPLFRSLNKQCRTSCNKTVIWNIVIAGIIKLQMRNIQKDELEYTTQNTGATSIQRCGENYKKVMNTQITFKLAWRQKDSANVSGGK